MFTRCPKCNTAFRIHAKQLGAASGLVRCGSCQYIFQALEHLFELTPGTHPLAAAMPAPKPKAPPVAAAVIPPVAAATEPKKPALDERLPAEEVLPPIIIRSGLPSNTPHGALRQQPENTNALPKAASGPAATSALKPATITEPTFAQPAPAADFKPAASVPPTDNEFDFTRARFSRVAPPQDAAFDTPEIDHAALERDNAEIANMLAEIESRLKEQPPGTLPAADPVTLVETMEPTPELVHAAQVHVAPAPARAEPVVETASPIDEDLTQIGGHASLAPEGAAAAAEPEPAPAYPEAVFDLRQKPGSRLPLLWSAAVLILIVGIFAQLVYFNRNELARQPQLRPWMEQLCGLMDCKIPLRVDLNAFELSDRDVRTHPQQAGQLLVSATIKNNAAFAQPYPVVELSFRSIEGQLITKHLFNPSDYVGKNLSLDNGIASQQTQRLSMAIPDPGPTAINFLFDFLPAPENQP